MRRPSWVGMRPFFDLDARAAASGLCKTLDERVPAGACRCVGKFRLSEMWMTGECGPGQRSVSASMHHYSGSAQRRKFNPDMEYYELLMTVKTRAVTSFQLMFSDAKKRLQHHRIA